MDDTDFPDMSMAKKIQNAMKIAELAKEIGWTVAFDKIDANDILGVIIGEKQFVEEIIEQIPYAEFHVESPENKMEMH